MKNKIMKYSISSLIIILIIILIFFNKRENKKYNVAYNTNFDISEHDKKMIAKYGNNLKVAFILGEKVYIEEDIEIPEEKIKDIKSSVGKNVFIYHTHGTESYKSKENYEMYQFYRSTDNNYNVINIGNCLEEKLKSKNFNVIHNKSFFDLPSVAGAYDRARVELKEELKKNKEINLIIDVHRDAISEEEHKATTLNINGEKLAELRFVLGVDKTNDNYLYTLKLMIDLQKKANILYPGLFQPILIRKREYNQDLISNSILIEVGENCNQIEEAINSINCFAEILSL